jgi:hypothetical protein
MTTILTMIRRSFKVVRFVFKAVVFAFQLHRAFQASPTGKAFEARVLHNATKFSKRLAAFLTGVYPAMKLFVLRFGLRHKSSTDDTLSAAGQTTANKVHPDRDQ